MPTPTTSPESLLKGAVALDIAGQREEARRAYEVFLALDPSRAPVWADYGGLLLRLGYPEKALEACRKALALAPGLLAAELNLARALLLLGRLDEAEFHCRHVLIEDSGNIEAKLMVTDVLMARKVWAAARGVLDRLLESLPEEPKVLQRLHNVCIRQGDWPALRKDLERQLEAFSGDEALYEHSLIDLLFGGLPEAWEGFEHRLRVPGRIRPSRSFAQPVWDGTPFRGETLLVHWEQGAGDTLMFLRYLPQTKALGGTVLLLVQPALAELAGTCAGIDKIIAEGEPLSDFDLQVSLFSLPAIFRTDLNSIPAEIPYLDVPERVPHREVLTELLALAQRHGKARVGLVWAGNPDHKRDAERSIPEAALAPLGAIPGVAWFSLQKGQTQTPPLPDLVSLGPILENFSDTAYALSGMDLVITVDTAIAHLAGALGIPTLLLLTFQPDFRWLLDRDDSPWYPSLRLYRQPMPGDWDSVIQRVVDDLTREA